MQLGTLVRRAVTLRSNAALWATQVRTLRGALPITEADNNDGTVGDNQPSFRHSKANRPITGKVIKEKFERYPIRAQRQLKEPPPMIEIVTPEVPQNPVPKKEYTEEQQARFAEVAEIGKEDALKDYRISQFNAEFLDTIGPGIRPVYNVAALANKVEVIQKLIHLGVSMFKWDNKPHITERMIKLDWKNDCEPRIELLVNQGGVDPEDLSTILTKNPLLLCEDYQHLEARLEYLRADASNYKNGAGWGLTTSETGRIIAKDPFWLSFSLDRLENRVDFFRNQFKLDKEQLRGIMIRSPKVVTANLRRLILNKLSMLDEFGFSFTEVQQMLIRSPKLFIMNKEHLLMRFDILHQQIGYDHEMIATIPQVLFTRESRLRERLAFLQHKNRAQFNSKRPAFVTPMQIAQTSDEAFVKTVARSTMEEFENFIKTH